MRRWTDRRSRLALRDLVAEAFASITRRPARSLLTALGTVAGVGAFVATTGLAATAQAQVGSSFDALKATQVVVVDATPDGISPFPSDAQARLERLSGVRAAGSFWTIDNDRLDPRPVATPSSQPSGIPVVAADPGAVWAARPVLSTGRIYDGFHAAGSDRVAVLGRQAADRLGVYRVDNQPAVFLGDYGYTIVGILDSVARNEGLLSAVIVPSNTASAELRSGSETTFSVLIDVEPGAADLIGRQAVIALRPDDPATLNALIPPDPRQLRETIDSNISNLLYGLAGLSLLVGMVGIANTTLVAVMERRSEIGVRRALGARRRHIAAQFLAESAALGVLGGLIGTCLGIIAVVAVAAGRGWTTTVDPILVFPAPIVGMLAGLASGVHPAAKAARTPPAAALRA